MKAYPPASLPYRHPNFLLTPRQNDLLEGWITEPDILWMGDGGWANGRGKGSRKGASENVGCLSIQSTDKIWSLVSLLLTQESDFESLRNRLHGLLGRI